MAAAKKKITLTLRKGLNKRSRAQQSCVHGLGLRRVGQTVTVQDTAETRGMIGKVSFLVDVAET